MLRDFREHGDPLDGAAAHDEVVFWFEHDLHDQLLLVHHLWWLSRQPPGRTRFSIVIGTDYLGLLRADQFPARFATRRPITDGEIAAGAAAWTAFCGDDPPRLALLAEDAGPLVYVPRAMRPAAGGVPGGRQRAGAQRAADPRGALARARARPSSSSSRRRASRTISGWGTGASGRSSSGWRRGRGRS